MPSAHLAVQVADHEFRPAIIGHVFAGIGVDGFRIPGKEAVEMKPGDCINIPAEVKHWHGAASDDWFSHLAIEVPGVDCSNEWWEAVSEEEYAGLR